MIQRELGFGQVAQYAPRHDPRGITSNPQAIFSCYSKSDCLKLVALFDQHPLRAKKARDYAVWREAVLLLNSSNYGGYSTNDIFALKEKLESGRVYQEDSQCPSKE